MAFFATKSVGLYRSKTCLSPTESSRFSEVSAPQLTNLRRAAVVRQTRPRSTRSHIALYLGPIRGRQAVLRVRHTARTPHDRRSGRGVSPTVPPPHKTPISTLSCVLLLTELYRDVKARIAVSSNLVSSLSAARCFRSRPPEQTDSRSVMSEVDGSHVKSPSEGPASSL